MPRTSSRTRGALLMVGAAGAVLALSGCSSPAQPGAAAVVGAERITDTQVADRTTEVLTALGGKLPDGVTEADLNRRVISNGIQEYLIDAAATREGIDVTAGQVTTLKDQAVKSSGGVPQLLSTLAKQYSIPPSGLDSFLRTEIQVSALINKLGKGDQKAGNAAAGKYLGALSTELGTDVSPRFGVWSAQNVGVGPPPNDLSSPAAVATALPAPAVPSPSSS